MHDTSGEKAGCFQHSNQRREQCVRGPAVRSTCAPPTSVDVAEAEAFVMFQNNGGRLHHPWWRATYPDRHWDLYKEPVLPPVLAFFSIAQSTFFCIS